MTNLEANLLQPGQMFAEKYRVKKFLAKGAMGAVFVGEHVATEQVVAIKVLLMQAMSSSSAEQLFAEARIANRVRSKHIVQVLDAGMDAETKLFYIVMELLEGETLEERVETKGPLHFTEVIPLLSQVASGLDKAHQYRTKDNTLQPIVHRDLKPENLFLTKEEDGSTLVKILDFGIAKVISKETSKATNQPKGTPLYMAPEQLMLKGISPGTDIWALGLITFFLLTGRSYWRSALDEQATIYSLFSEIGGPKDPPTLRAQSFNITPPWPPAFDDWFLKILATDPKERFPTASAAIEELARVFQFVLPSRPSLDPSYSSGSYPELPPSVALGKSADWKSSMPGVSIRSDPEARLGPAWGGRALLGGLALLVLGAGGYALKSRMADASTPAAALSAETSALPVAAVSSEVVPAASLPSVVPVPMPMASTPEPSDGKEKQQPGKVTKGKGAVPSTVPSTPSGMPSKQSPPSNYVYNPLD